MTVKRSGRKLPARTMRFVLPFFISVIMTCLVSGISTLRSVGLTPEFMVLWPGNWAFSWVVGFPVLLCVMPVARRLAGLVVEA